MKVKQENINWDEIPIGSKFTAAIRDIKLKGRIQKEHAHIFLCQNEQYGNSPFNSLGFKNGWNISSGSQQDIKNNSVTNLVIELDPKFNIEDFEVKLIIEDLQIKIGEKSIARVYANPFSNCQNLCIAGFDRVSSLDKKNIAALFQALSSMKRFTVLDVRSYVLDALPEDESLYLFKTNYRSTSGSNMCILGIKNKEAADYYSNLINIKK